MLKNSLIPTAALLAFCVPAATIAQSSPTPLPPNYIRVDAPMAERLIVAEFKKHSATGEIGKIGLHATPPGASDNVIIASEIPSKIGKKSSPQDMQKLAEAKPIAVKVDKDSIYDLLLPITDRNGGDLNGGFVVMEVPFAKAQSEQEALKIGISIRDELQSEIPSKAALYQP
jgi:hypothetical protein